ncbi:enoyl-CoA hydratase/isomerase family protein, partial [Vibrio parahaemolyticus V-223/04]
SGLSAAAISLSVHLKAASV